MNEKFLCAARVGIRISFPRAYERQQVRLHIHQVCVMPLSVDVIREKKKLF